MKLYSLDSLPSGHLNLQRDGLAWRDLLARLLSYQYRLRVIRVVLRLLFLAAEVDVRAFVEVCAIDEELLPADDGTGNVGSPFGQVAGNRKISGNRLFWMGLK